MDKHQFQPGDSIIVRPGEQFEELNLDISGWRGRVMEIDEEDDDLLIAWDSQTLREIPETAVAALLEDWTDWTCMYIEPEAVLPYEPRGEVVDALAVARARTEVYGIEFDEIANNPLFYDLIDEDWDEDWDEEWDEDDWTPEPAPYFDLDQFLYGLEIPPKEHPHVRLALSKGLGQYFYDVYGRYEHGKQPADLIPGNMGVPFIFGYGALAVIDHKPIGQDTKQKICQYALVMMNPVYDDGLPYGLVTLLGFLAQTGELALPLFQLGMITLEFGGVGSFRRSVWQFGTRREAALALLDWLARNPDITTDEKCFWVWRWSLECEYDPHLVKALANAWLTHPDVPAESKRQLCWAWLQNAKEVGAPPQTWQIMNAFLSGNREKLEQLLAGMDNLPDLPFPKMMPPSADDGEAGLIFQLLHGPRDLWLTPAPLKRIAIPALARLGDDPQTVADMFWGSGDDEYYVDAIHSGIADLLREFQAQIPPAELRRLVEQGLSYGRVTVRKTFHILARDLYGNAYLPQALADSAKSLRTWAEEQQNKP